MAYVPTSWQDYPNTSTPITAARLNNIESGVTAAYVTGSGLLTNADFAAGVLAASKITNYPADVSKGLRGDGTWVATQLDYATISASVTTTATTEGTATAFITGNSVTYDGTMVKIEVFSPSLQVDAATLARLTLVLYRDSTVLGQMFVETQPKTTGVNQPSVLLVATFDTPAAGAHTYKVGGFVSSSTGTFGAGTGGSGNLVNAFLRVSRAA